MHFEGCKRRTWFPECFPWQCSQTVASRLHTPLYEKMHGLHLPATWMAWAPGLSDSMTTAAPGIDPKLRMGIEVLKPEAVDWKRVGLAQSLPRMYSPYSFVMGWVGETEASDNTVNNSRVKDHTSSQDCLSTASHCCWC